MFCYCGAVRWQNDSRPYTGRLDNSGFQEPDSSDSTYPVKPVTKVKRREPKRRFALRLPMVSDLFVFPFEVQTPVWHLRLSMVSDLFVCPFEVQTPVWQLRLSMVSDLFVCPFEIHNWRRVGSSLRGYHASSSEFCCWCLFVCLSVCLSVFLFVCLPVSFYLFVRQYILCLSVLAKLRHECCGRQWWRAVYIHSQRRPEIQSVHPQTVACTDRRDETHTCPGSTEEQKAQKCEQRKDTRPPTPNWWNWKKDKRKLSWRRNLPSPLYVCTSL